MASSKHAMNGVSPHRAMQALHQAVEANIDPLGMAMPLWHAQLAWLSHPQELAEAASGFSTRMLALMWHSWLRLLGLPSPDVELPNPDDIRFADPVWTESASWDILKEWYLTFTHHIQDMLYQTPGLSSRDRRRAAFWWRKWLNAMAPTNFLLTNPVGCARQWKAMATACCAACATSLPICRPATCA